MKAPLSQIAVFMALAFVLAGCSSQSKSRRLPDAEPIPISRNDPASVYVELATTYLREGQPLAALTNAEKALAIDPSRQEVRLLQAMAKSALGYNAEAEALLRQILSSSPNDPYASNALGTLLCGQSRHSEAVAQFDAAARSPANNQPWVAYTNGALCEFERGQLGAAEQRFLDANRVNPRFGPALLGLARLNQSRGNSAQARNYINRYFQVAAPDEESLLLAYRIESSLGNSQGAETYATILRERFPDSPQTMRLLGP